MKCSVVLLLLLVTCVSGAPLSCVGVTPRLTHDGHGFQIHAPMVAGANAMDAHVELNGAHDVLNVRMIASSTEPGIYELPQPIQAIATSPISFHFTYMSPSAPACDSITFGTAARGAAAVTAPAPAPAPEMTPEANAAPAETTACSLPPIQHQVMRNDAGAFVVQVSGPQPYSWIDLHATVGSDESNIRIGHDVATAQSAPITIAAGEELTYSLTYAVGDVSCLTGMFATGPLN